MSTTTISKDRSSLYTVYDWKYLSAATKIFLQIIREKEKANDNVNKESVPTLSKRKIVVEVE